MTKAYQGLRKVSGTWVPHEYPAGQWHGSQFLSATLRWYTKAQVAGGALTTEPAFYAQSRTAQTQAEHVAQARHTLTCAVAERPSPRPGQSAAEAFTKALEGTLWAYAKALGVTPAQVWTLAGVKQPGEDPAVASLPVG